MNDATITSKPYPAQSWRMPPLSTAFLCDDAVQRTLGEMIAGYGDDFVPKSDEDVLMVLEHYGADWTSPAVTHSFKQRDNAIGALNDPDRYRESEDRLAGYRRMRWAFDYLVNETIAEFVLRRLPDAHDWEDGVYRVTSLDGNEGQVYRVEADIPTSAQDCWVSFEIAIPNLGREPLVLFFQAVRGGTGADEETTYVCNGLDEEWVGAESEYLE